MVMTALTRERVVERFQEVHGDKYDYSQLEWVNRQTQLTIICREHGPFYHLYNTHTSGRGCKSCYIESSKLTSAEFFAKIIGSKNEKYLYKDSEFKDSKTFVKLKCSIHGVFDLDPKSTMLRRQEAIFCKGCRPKMEQKLSYEEVIRRFKVAHGERYDYSLTRYSKTAIDVEIICRVHGLFKIKPQNHWGGAGCKKCNRIIDSTEKCVAKFRKVHGNRYDYSKVDYQGAETPVTIICPEHGEFPSNPANHWKPRKSKARGESCPTCNSRVRKQSSNEIITRFQKVHGEVYDYSEFEYSDMHKLAIIICRLHGPFPMSPANHLQGHRCKWCARQDDSSAQRIWFDAFLKELVYDSAEMEVDLLGGRWGAVDLVLTIQGVSIALEYDGQYWHSRDDSMDKDTRKTAAISALGYPVLRLRTIETQRHAQLEAVPGAVNIWVKDKPKLEDIERVKKVLKKWVHF